MLVVAVVPTDDKALLKKARSGRVDINGSFLTGDGKLQTTKPDISTTLLKGMLDGEERAAVFGVRALSKTLTAHATLVAPATTDAKTMRLLVVGQLQALQKLDDPKRGRRMKFTAHDLDLDAQVTVKGPPLFALSSMGGQPVCRTRKTRSSIDSRRLKLCSH